MADSKDDAATRLKKAKDFKEQGTKLFKDGNFVKAIVEYRKIFENLEGKEMVGQNEAERKGLVKAGQSNIAECYMKLEDWKSAKAMWSKILEKKQGSAKALLQRGECSMNMNEFKDALEDLNDVKELEPKNKEAKNLIKTCSQKMKLVREPKLPSIESLPNFCMEYKNKYGANRDEMIHIFQSYDTFSSASSESLNSMFKEIAFMCHQPQTFLKRWGVYAQMFSKKKWEIGEIIDIELTGSEKDRPLNVYDYRKFQTMKNSKIVPWIFSAGEHVSLGCTDFAQLLFGSFDTDSNQEIHFHGVDSSLVSIVRCKVLYQMILNGAASRSILQVWFSTGWSMDTFKEFVDACTELLKNAELLGKDEVNLLKHWMSTWAPLETASKRSRPELFAALHKSMVRQPWFIPSSAPLCFQPCANFKHEIDRVDLARYLFTGYIFEESEEKLICGNTTMFSIPSSMGVNKVPNENFYYTFDCLGKFSVEYKDSLKLTADRFMMKKMETLKNLVNEKSLKMTFELGIVSKENTPLLNKIRAMNPDTIDWSNIPDYLNRRVFLDLAKKMSGENTVHCLHLMNWWTQINGTFIGDYPEDDWKKIIVDGIAFSHDVTSKNGIYPNLWRKDFIFSNKMNPTQLFLCDRLKDNFLKYLFGDLKYQFETSMDHISYNPGVLTGAFTFGKDLKLKFDTT